MEFRKGDKVWNAGEGNGIVINVINVSDPGYYPILVKFERERIGSFTPEGRSLSDEDQRSLYHGHDCRVVGERIPVRKGKGWINYYYNSGFPWTSMVHSTKEDAEHKLFTGNMSGQTLEVEIDE